MAHELKPVIHTLLPRLLAILTKDASKRNETACVKALDILHLFDSDLQPSLNLVLAAVLRLSEDKSAPMDLRVSALRWVVNHLFSFILLHES